jgi:hypothetical protein
MLHCGLIAFVCSEKGLRPVMQLMRSVSLSLSGSWLASTLPVAASQGFRRFTCLRRLTVQ